MLKVKPVQLPIKDVVIGADGKLTNVWANALTDLQITINKIIASL